MTEDRRTKAQLLEELDEVKQNLKATIERNSELENRPAPKRVAAAEALAGCIRALDPLAESNSGVYASERRSSRDEITGVVRHLIDRYRLDLTERVVEPCARPHVEDASDDILLNALRSKSFGMTF